jgi:predicted secreted protein
MNFVSAFVVFAVTWFLALYCLLPVGVRSQEEAGDDIPEGAMTGAPSKANMKMKAIGATVISAIFTAIIYFLVSERILTLGALDRLFGMEE